MKKPGCCHIAWASFWCAKVLQCSAGKLWAGSLFWGGQGHRFDLQGSQVAFFLQGPGLSNICQWSHHRTLSQEQQSPGHLYHEGLSHWVPSRAPSSHWPSDEPSGRSTGQGKEAGALVMTKVIDHWTNPEDTAISFTRTWSSLSISLSTSGQKKSGHSGHGYLSSPLLGVLQLQEMFQDSRISLLSHPFSGFKSSEPPSPFAQSDADSSSLNNWEVILISILS